MREAKDISSQGAFPEEDDIVVIKINKVLNYGAFGELVEFKGLQGFVHVSNASSGWVKNIRNYVKENQIRAAKVLSVNKQKKEVELSLAKVSKHLEKLTIDEYNQFIRVQKLLEVLAKQQKKDFSFIWEAIAVPLMDSFDSLNEALREIAVNKEQSLPKEIPKDLVKPLLELIEKNITIPEKSIKLTLSIQNMDGDGVIKIKNFCKEILKDFKSKKLAVYYNGSGKYNVKVTAVDYKKAEKILKEFSDSFNQNMKKFNIKGVIERLKE